MNLYVKLFLAAAVPYGLVAALILHSPAFGVLFGVGIGIVIASIFGTLQHSAFQGKKADADRSVHQIRDIEIDVSYNEALALCQDSLKTLTRAHIKQLDADQGIIHARTGMNWKTYGERVTLSLLPIDQNTTRIRIESRPRLKTTLIDYGSNLYNVNCISLYLRQQSGTDNLAQDFSHLEIDDETPSLRHLIEYGDMAKQQS
jgi:hypothetical protein